MNFTVLIKRLLFPRYSWECGMGIAQVSKMDMIFFREFRVQWGR